MSDKNHSIQIGGVTLFYDPSVAGDKDRAIEAFNDFRKKESVTVTVISGGAGGTSRRKKVTGGES